MGRERESRSWEEGVTGMKYLWKKIVCRMAFTTALTQEGSAKTSRV